VARVLIADEDPDALDLLGDILCSPAVEICRATSGAELVVMLAERDPFDLVVTDIVMPWMEVERLGNAKLVRKPVAVAALRKTVSEMLGGAS